MRENRGTPFRDWILVLFVVAILMGLAVGVNNLLGP